jgi:hypothetical protein
VDGVEALTMSKKSGKCCKKYKQGKRCRQCPKGAR